MNTSEFYDSAPLGICAIRRDRRRMDMLYANPVLANFVGVKNASELLGRTMEDIWPGKETDKLVRRLKSTTPPPAYALPLGDEKRWIKLTIEQKPFDGEDAYILWASDISKQYEAIEAADAAAEAKSNFLATMSHEIRTPMQTIYGLLELIGEEKPDERIAAMLDTSKTAASGLLEILDDILDLAKMDADSMELDTFELPVRTLVRGILEALAVRVKGDHVKLVDDIAEDVPFVVIGDPKRLRQIIMNLTGNALKFTSEGSVTVRVTTGVKAITKPENGVALRFEIIDSGIGMSEEAQARLFQPFSQADNSTSRKYGGTGLGLSICKKLVELMGGQIGVTSKEGEGSTFWFEIPTEEVDTENSTLELPELDGISVLSVEDHPQGAKEIVRSLQSMGATVESCPTVAEGLTLIKRRPFDVAVIDQGLPDGLGIDLIRDILNIRPFTGLVMYTVRDDIGLQHTLNTLGVTYLPKPAGRLGLGEAVRDAAQKTARVSLDGPAKLLIAEDTESVRDVLRRQLEKLGVEADFAENGREALSALESGEYGILFTDLHMPEMDGYDVIQMIRKRDNPDSPFPAIVLTADVQMAQRQAYLAHGFDECLLKPVSLGQLRRLLIRWGLLEEEKLEEEEETTPRSSQSTDGKPPALDRGAIEAQMGAFDDSTVEMLGMFIQMTEPLIERLKTALANEDWHDLSETAHSLKGGAHSACCNVLGDLAARLQDDAAAKDPSCPALVEDIAQEFERAGEEIRALKS